MKQRCDNPRSTYFLDYGGRGIRYCARWADFSAFLSDMGPRPFGMTLDRIDNDGPYSPENCRWATRRQQALNKRVTRWITFRGETKPLAEWAGLLGIGYAKTRKRLARGWPPDQAFTKP
jgi:hypothetical protein